MKNNVNRYQHIIDAVEHLALPDEYTQNLWIDALKRWPEDEVIRKFKEQFPQHDYRFLYLDDSARGDEHREIMLMKYKHKKEISEIYKRGLASGAFKKKAYVTQEDFNTAYRIADTGQHDTGVEVLTEQAEGKPATWLEQAKKATSPNKIKEARSKVISKKDNRKLLANHLAQARATTETNQNLAGALTTFINNKKAMAVLVEHEIRLRDSEERHNKAELAIAALQAEVAMLKGESRSDRIRKMLSGGFTQLQVASALEISRSTVAREVAKVINP